MQMSKLLAPDLVRILEEHPDQLSEALQEVHAEDIADIVVGLDPELAVRLAAELPAPLAADVLERLPEELQVHIVRALEPRRSAEVVTEMDADDRADLVQDLPDPLRELLLAEVAQTEPEVAEELRNLAAYPDDTAGGLMTTEYLALWPELTCAEAIDELRVSTRERDPETVYYLYVVAYDRLVGVLSLRDLLLSDPEETLANVMTEKVVTVLATADQEKVARKIAKYDLAAVPVVDEQNHMLGVVTIDDVVDVVIDEATEDAHRMGAVMPMEESYFSTGFVPFVRNRVTWLIVLFVGELLTASVMDAYEHQLAALMDLVIFVPLIISSGGNSGSQSSSLIIRALAVGEMSPSDWPRVFVRELAMGLTLGIVLGVVGFGRAFLGHGIDEPAAMGLTIAVSIVAVVTLGTLVGSLMPLAIQRLGGDPAVSSTPFVASLVDVFGLVVYFSVARVIFGVLM